MTEAAEPRPVVFLDRDGVLLEEAGLLVRADQMRIAPGVPEALARLRRAGFELVVATNQAVVARGLVSEDEVAELNRVLAVRIAQAGGPEISAFYVCPHHPRATVPRYRVECGCRKPRPGLLLRAVAELGLDLRRGFVIGDRLSDVAAGARAGCRTVLVRTGAHREPPIETPDPVEPELQPDRVCDDLPAAVAWILEASA